MDNLTKDHELQQRLVTLQEKICIAEARLLDLLAATEAAKSDEGLKALATTLVDNQRLRDANLVAEQNATGAIHALQDAIQASRTDPLTGLLNRLTLWDRLAHEIERAKRGKSFVAVYFLDLDSFKTVNDTHGHSVGDRLLQHVAHELTNSVRASDSVCRIGGDEFAMVFSAPTVEDIGKMSDKIKSALTHPFFLDGKSLSYSVSVGCSIYPNDATNPSKLLEMADERMYSDKKVHAAKHR